ncbi:MAG TPA: methyltransferase domain-containing protein [Planctomycetes bacterium]|nr:methyltransferase domain-containing protein [Planctomycetota bacterium]
MASSDPRDACPRDARSPASIEPPARLEVCFELLAEGEVDLALVELTRIVRRQGEDGPRAASTLARVLDALGAAPEARAFDRSAGPGVESTAPPLPTDAAARFHGARPVPSRGARVERALADCAARHGFADKHVIELGGALPEPSIRALGVRSWTSLTSLSPERLAPRHRVLPLSARPVPLAAEHYHLVFLAAPLHHLPDPGFALAESARLLRPGGILFASLGPLWSGPSGWSCFEDWGDGAPLLPGWSQLLFEEADLAAWLGVTVGAERRNELAARFHAQTRGVRLFEEDVFELFRDAPLLLERLEPVGTECAPSPRLRERLAAIHPGHSRFGAKELRIELRKGGS